MQVILGTGIYSSSSDQFFNGMKVDIDFKNNKVIFRNKFIFSYTFDISQIVVEKLHEFNGWYRLVFFDKSSGQRINLQVISVESEVVSFFEKHSLHNLMNNGIE